MTCLAEWVARAAGTASLEFEIPFPTITSLVGLLIAISLLSSEIPTDRYHRHSITCVWAVLDIDKCRYRAAMKNRQQELVVPEFVKAAIGVKIMAILMKKII
jgi:hypothetical protein